MSRTIRPTLIIIALALFAFLSSACTRERPVPEATPTVALPAAPVVATESSGEPQVTPPEVTPTPEQDVTPTVDAAASVVELQEYEVQSGDTLGSIALKYDVDPEAIKKANEMVDDLVRVGQRLFIPIDAGTPTPTPAPFAYVVKKGETLGDIALRFGVEPLAIIEANNLIDGNMLTVGMELNIPGYTPEVAQPKPATTAGESAAGANAAGGDAASTAGDAVTHIVQPGETLSEIAQKYAIDEPALAAANGITNRNQLRAGQELIVPGITQQQALAARSVRHVVKSGETLSKIAQQYGVDAQDIVRANNLANPNAIYVGQELLIPQ